MTSQIGQKIITIHTLPNISRSKGNQAMKFGQLVDYNLRNVSKKWPKTLKYAGHLNKLYKNL